MKNLILTAASLLIFVPCVVAQDAPPPPSQGAPATGAPASHMHQQGQRMEMQHGRGMELHEHGKFDGGGGPMMMGAWWKSPEVAARIGLTPEQGKKIDDLFLQSKVELIHQHAQLEEQELMLHPLMDANPVDQAKAMAQIDKIADTRAELEKTNAKMLLSIRAVLSADQWTKLQQRHEGMRGEHGPRGAQGMKGPHGSGAGHEGGAPAPPSAE